VRPVLLTVDDDPQVVWAIERDLRRQYGKRFRILKAESGQKALGLVKQLKLRNEIVALLLVDQRMPQMSTACLSTFIYIPYKIHYNPTFKVWSTSNHLEWHGENQVMKWWPDRNEMLNQIIITPPISDKIDTSILPQISNDLMNKTNFSQEFGS
jgi:hypothetical protein